MSERWYRNEVDRLRRELAAIGRQDGTARQWTSPTLATSAAREIIYLRARATHKRIAPRLAKLEATR